MVLMLNIAIVDDELMFLKQLHRKIETIGLFDYKIYEFQSGEEFLINFEKGKYDIIILDVEMSGINGLQTAERIRINDKSVIIAFLTNYSEFAVQGYEVNAFRYILKSQPEYLYEKQLNSIFDEYKQKFKMYSYTNQNMSFKYKLIDIVYFEVYNRQILLHTVTDNVEYYASLSDIYEELKDFNFIKPGKSCVVNLEHIRRIDKNNLIMSNGDKILIGRAYKKEVVSQYLNFMSGR